MRVVHVLDDSTSWTHRVGVGQLVDRLAPDRFEQVVLTTHPRAAKELCREGKMTSQLVTRFGRYPILAAPAVALSSGMRPGDVAHAWGLSAALTCRAAGVRRIVLTAFDPAVSQRQAKILRTLANLSSFAIACDSETVKRRLVESGVRPEACVIVRPGVDFRLINGYKRNSSRQDWGVARDDFLVVLPPCDTAHALHFDAAWACRLSRFLDGDLWIAIPGDGLARQRIYRFDRSLIGSPALIDGTRDFPFEQLVCIADALIVASRSDVSTTAIAWAMAAGTIVIGAAVHSVAELIGSGLNGKLFNAKGPCSPAPAIYRCLTQRDDFRKLVEVARGHAYEVFGLRRCVDQYAQIYENLMHGRPPGDGIVDAAAA